MARFSAARLNEELDVEIKYLVIDTSDGYYTSIGKYDSKEKMLDAIQHKDIKELEVFEVNKRIRLQQRPAIIAEDD